MSSFERQIHTAVRNGATVNFRVIPTYSDNNARPIGVTLTARDSNGFDLDVSIPNITGVPNLAKFWHSYTALRDIPQRIIDTIIAYKVKQTKQKLNSPLNARKKSKMKILILPIVTLFSFPSLLSANSYQCNLNRICYDTLPCAGVKDPNVEFCRDRITCDPITPEVSILIELKDNNVRLTHPFSLKKHSYNILSKYYNEYSADNFTHYTFSNKVDEQNRFVKNIIYLEVADSKRRDTEIVSIDISTSPERGTTTSYGICELVNN